MTMTAPQAESVPGNIKVTRQDWIKLALETLISDGIESVRVLALGQKLGVSRSSFYWYFESRQDLLDQLLKHWYETNTRAIVERARRPAASIIMGVLNVFECWADERLFDPRLDFAVREWARRSSDVRRMIDRADDDRLLAIRDMYKRHGYDAEDAFIRARVLYYMQIGYYVLDLKEPVEARVSHLAAYLRAFTGLEPSEADVAHFMRFIAAR
ncbi:TetR/AcrR family transcriptional regulator [Mesorhizobium sp. M2D.F.Ca.ET.185.01.1.1]|uniref:TetR/AcrR family transcriptional regulator n=1 Tax=unclassified Mesorhizobium TaxID=325217 RepID=UPI000FCB2820|nr:MULTISPECIES: TetR/AcrR family transcriptional regulator [unclassified Mesorhizobium]TGP76332.1 TetR/AcrR family transcriptional regulator [bacterium M00.F.Ca.ET.227.01.1.1]TGP92384.1 TetR/AcrR family transcriptional regulator [bacterium M00.F.Ca.ET.222.01.1.1]TGP96939.1 TetR/AcrR family transcriptional regulator [bacterium M00.F.Ca.ET.221.01.1.1]TGU06599.1 TetR/AcrR family transcriptional regulator [bacterium M00.F.Ca.ET.163.01.1.1]TGU27774.1 TetR/AcrR family transcriptional regulator [bac